MMKCNAESGAMVVARPGCALRDRSQRIHHTWPRHDDDFMRPVMQPWLTWTAGEKKLGTADTFESQ